MINICSSNALDNVERMKDVTIVGSKNQKLYTAL